MKKIMTILILILMTINVNAQRKIVKITVLDGDTTYWYEEKAKRDTSMYYDEEGYVLGANIIGIQAKGYQPVYGFTFQQQFGKYVNVEGDISYIQVQTRQLNATHNIRDYGNMMLLLKLGRFGHKAGVYSLYGFSISPSFNHSNPENHTYTSFHIGGGTQVNITKKKVVEFKLMYCVGLRSGYMIKGQWQDFYSGTQFMMIFKRRR